MGDKSLSLYNYDCKVLKKHGYPVSAACRNTYLTFVANIVLIGVVCLHDCDLQGFFFSYITYLLYQA